MDLIFKDSNANEDLRSQVDTDDPLVMRAVLSHLGRALHMVGTESSDEAVASSRSSLPSLASELGKLTPRVHINDHGIMIRTQISGLVKNLFTHLPRNALDHGLETPPERLAKGKPEFGRIDIEVSVDDGQLRIRQRAIDKQIQMPDEPVSAEDIAMLIFRSGFIKGEGGHIEIRFLDEHEGANFRAFETLIYLPDKYAASLDAALTFEALRARALAGIGTSTQAA